MNTSGISHSLCQQTKWVVVRKSLYSIQPTVQRSCQLNMSNSIFFADGKLQLAYSGLPPVEGCSRGNPKVVFYFECGNNVGQPQFKTYVGWERLICTHCVSLVYWLQNMREVRRCGRICQGLAQPTFHPLRLLLIRCIIFSKRLLSHYYMLHLLLLVSLKPR